MQQMPRDYDMTSMLSHPVFNSLEFARFCETMQRDAADEIQTLHYDLDKTLGHAGYYDASAPQHNAGYSAVRSSYGGPGPTLHPASPVHPDDGAMTIGTPEGEPYLPMISPSPPVGAHDMARSSVLFMDIPARGAAATRSALGAAQPMSYSMPNRSLDGWGDGYFNGDRTSSTLATTATSTTAGFSAHASSAHPLAKRLRPGASIPVSTPNSGSSYSTMSPKTYWRTFHPQRPVKSPTRQSRSPAMSSVGFGIRGAATLPPILQYAQPKTVTSPMQMDANSLKDGSEQPNEQPLDTKPIMSGARRSSDSTIDECSAVVSGGGEITPSEIEQINSLREENAIMRDRIQRLEMSVTQKQAEVQTWMTQIEMRIAQSKGRSL
ncbi:hypothetical protein IWW46_005320 [Coemansia sp. RSA 2440]|nr:hypothetical protein IWW46_005320 [Coemansia sp. RSA 2440]